MASCRRATTSVAAAAALLLITTLSLLPCAVSASQIQPSECRPVAGTSKTQCNALIAACATFTPPVYMYWLSSNPCSTGGNGCQFADCPHLQCSGTCNKNAGCMWTGTACVVRVPTYSPTTGSPTSKAPVTTRAPTDRPTSGTPTSAQPSAYPTSLAPTSSAPVSTSQPTMTDAPTTASPLSASPTTTKQPQSQAPTASPTASATPAPSTTSQPTSLSTSQPTKPTKKPTAHPSHHPSKQPTAHPSHHPSKQPSAFPTHKATNAPTALSTESPVTAAPTDHPSRQPTQRPTRPVTSSPTHKPVVTASPTPQPTTAAPTKRPIAAVVLFRSAAKHNGNLGGVVGADAMCQAVADDMEIGCPGGVLAFLSSCGFGATRSCPLAERTISFLPPQGANYDVVIQSASGIKIADSWLALRTLSDNVLSTTLMKAGVVPDGSPFWTGARLGGSASGDDCVAWYSASSNKEGGLGSSETIGYKFMLAGAAKCSAKQYFLCACFPYAAIE